jgi:hypothetical protein
MWARIPREAKGQVYQVCRSVLGISPVAGDEEAGREVRKAL